MKQLSVMVVDDEPGIRDLFRDVITKRGHQAICAESGSEALEKLQTKHVDVVFLDIRMPNGDGISALKHIRKFKPMPKVVIITGYGQCEAVDEAIELGSSLCLMKPFSIRDVTGVLEVVEA